jgi:hypothetical protein
MRYAAVKGTGLSFHSPVY